MPITKSNKQKTSLDLHKTKRKMDDTCYSLSTNEVLNLQLRTLQFTLVLHLPLTPKCDNNNNNNIALFPQASWGRLEMKPERNLDS